LVETDGIEPQFVVAPDRSIYFGCYPEFLAKGKP
jgi:hypothetical protein